MWSRLNIFKPFKILGDLMKRVLLCAAVAACAAAPVFAETGYYGSVSYNHLAWSGGDSITNDDIDFGTLTGMFGAKFTKHLGAEMELGYGVRKHDFSGFSNTSMKVTTVVGIYGRGELPLNDKFSIYARIGSANIEGEVNNSYTGADISENGVAAGVGADLFISEKVGIGAGYTRYEIGDGFDNFSVSAVFRFK